MASKTSPPNTSETKAEVRIAPLIADLLPLLGEDPTREGLLKTPSRVAASFQSLTEGYRQTIVEVVGDGIFAEDSSEMVVVKDVEFYSLCEHHLLPFFGRTHVAYIPKGRIIGLSKIPRLIDMYARRLQVQERMTREIAQAVESILAPAGVAVVCEASHFCMRMRGVEKQASMATTSCMLGNFREDSRTRAEFLSLIRSG